MPDHETAEVVRPASNLAAMPVLDAWSRGHAGAMLLVAAGGVAFALPAGVLSLVALGSFAVLLWLARGQYTPQGVFGAANAVSLSRLLLLCAFGTLVVRPGPREAALLVLIFALDGLDGWLARRQSTCSAFGARFDMEVDALMVLLVGFMLFGNERLPAFILVPGALRYAYVLALWVVPGRLREAPASRFGRYGFTLMAVALCASTWPLPWHRPFAALASLVIVLSFARSLLWSISQRS